MISIQQVAGLRLISAHTAQEKNLSECEKRILTNIFFANNWIICINFCPKNISSKSVCFHIVEFHFKNHKKIAAKLQEKQRPK